MSRSTGIIIIIVGIIILLWSRFTYNNSEKLIDGNSVQSYSTRQRSINWPPYLGSILVISGIVVAITAKKTRVK